MTKHTEPISSLPKVVSREVWSRARRELLAREKQWNRDRDALSAARRALPMVRVDTQYAFDGPNGSRTLAQLFGDKRQLVVYHFMFDPAADEGCFACAFVADNLAGSLVHLAARDTAFVAISRAPIEKIESFQKRLGWTFDWLSSHGNGFNHDFMVTVDEDHPAYNYEPDYLAAHPGYPSEREGLSVFVRDGGHVHHAYSTYARGLDLFLNTYNLLDHTPLGRQEGDEPMTWLRFHDRY